jgi:hypothetical protein
MREGSRLLLVVLVLVGLTGRAFAQEPDSAAEAGVRAALEHYMQGHATGEGAHMRAAFAPEAQLFWIREGQLATRTSEEFAAGFRGQVAPDEAQRKRWIEGIHITGDAAVARVILDYPKVRFTDYMSLLKIGDEWKIVNKTYVAQPKPAGDS